jgi:hypothetical protein
MVRSAFLFESASLRLRGNQRRGKDSVLGVVTYWRKSTKRKEGVSLLI